MTRNKAQADQKPPLPTDAEVLAAKSVLGRFNGLKGIKAMRAKYSKETRREWSARGGTNKGLNFAKKAKAKKIKN